MYVDKNATSLFHDKILDSHRSVCIYLYAQIKGINTSQGADFAILANINVPLYISSHTKPYGSLKLGAA
jgi:hypothetical protein